MGESIDLRLPDLNDKAVYYDGFFENKSLYSFFKVEERECCIDLNSQKLNREEKRYWLTTKKCDYKILRSFALSYKPIEMNVLLNTTGTELFLYDTTIKEPNFADKKYSELLYRYNIGNLILFVRKYGMKRLLNDFFRMLKHKLL